MATRDWKARRWARGDRRRTKGIGMTRKPSARTSSRRGPSAQAPTTSWPRARMARISGTRKWRSEKSTLVISMIFIGGNGVVGLWGGGGGGGWGGGFVGGVGGGGGVGVGAKVPDVRWWGTASRGWPGQARP